MTYRTTIWLLLGGVLLAGGCARELAGTAAVDADVMSAARAILEAGGAAAETEPASLGSPTGWATLKGTFVFSGAAARPPIPVAKDTEICGNQVPDQALVVGSNGALANVLVYVSTPIPADDPAWTHESYAGNATAEILFDQKKCVFLSRTAAMRSTQTMRVLNSDAVGHNTNFASKRGAKAQDVLIPAGGFATYAPGAASPQPIPVSCAIHPWMKASVMVCDHPYFAVSGDSGQFELAHLPAGVDLEIRVWHELPGYVQSATVNGQAETWSKGRFVLRLTDGEQRALNVELAAL